MSDDQKLFERSAARFDPPPDAFDRFLRRREGKRRRQQIGAAVVAIAVVAAVIGGFAILAAHPRTSPAEPNVPVGFAGAHGWIAVGGPAVVRAVNPADPSQQIVLSRQGGAPITWSRDGSALLIVRNGSLVVLREDGTEMELSSESPRSELGGGSFTADGSAVVYEEDWSIVEAPLDGGQRRTIATGHPDAGEGYFLPFYRGGQLSSNGVLAYERIQHARSDGIWLMNAADGSGGRKLVGNSPFEGIFGDVGLEGVTPDAWSPDGSKLLVMAVGNKRPSGAVDCATFVIAADGSKLSRVTPEGMCLWSATFSPDGSRITGNDETRVLTMNLDGSDIRTVLKMDGDVADPELNTAWNPVPPESGT